MRNYIGRPYFILNDDNTVTDTRTGLTWQRTLVGQKNGESEEFTHFEAVECANQTDGWRLPTIDELKTIIDKRFISPTLDPEVFINSPINSTVWSSSLTGYGRRFAYIVFFDNGSGSFVERDDYSHIRLVRD